MSAQAYAAVRTGAQFVVAWLVAHMTVFAAIPEATRNAIVEWAVTAVCVGLWTWGIRWLETRNGLGFWPSAARVAARLLMLGLGKQPVYPVVSSTTMAPAGVTFRNGTAKAVLPE